jgi:pre-mRNA 3'-end-processing factor FIP1
MSEEDEHEPAQGDDLEPNKPDEPEPNDESGGAEEDEDEDDEAIETQDEEDDGAVILQDNVVEVAAIDTAKRLHFAQCHTTPSGNYAAMRTTGDIFRLGASGPWEIVNPSGVHPKDPTKPIFAYDLSALPKTVEAKPWTAPDADLADWFNYGFTEATWEKYRKKVLKLIKDKKGETEISVLTEQTRK